MDGIPYVDLTSFQIFLLCIFPETVLEPELVVLELVNVRLTMVSMANVEIEAPNADVRN